MGEDNRGGCLGGLLQLGLLTWFYQFMQSKFGFGKGCSCSGLGCGLIMLILFLLIACSIIFSTDWFSLTELLTLPA